MTKLTCDQCGSERVDNFTKTPPKEATMTMKEYIDSDPDAPKAVNAVMIYTTMVLLCKDCGNRYEYTL